MSRLRLSIVAAFSIALLSFLPARAGQGPPPVGWPQILHDAAHTSVSPETKLNVTSARTLGINWMSSMRAADLGSPVAVYNAALAKTAVYVGDERGDVMAFDESNGTTLWSTSLGFNDFLRSSPMVAPDGSLWAGTGLDPTLYKLDGATGKVLCSLKVQLRIDSSIMFATPPGGVPTVYTATVDGSNAIIGQIIAVNESNCKQIWSFNNWRNPTGAWSTPAFGIDAAGKGRVYTGSASPDEEMYAVDALTGKLVWYHSAYEQGDFDIGSAATVSAPGNNGFADGVLYYHSKYGIEYADDLTTGKEIWEYNYDKAGHIGPGGISSAALYKTMLVYGVSDGVEAIDARTSRLLWHYNKAEDVVSSPAIVGPPGGEIVVVGDATGRVIALRLADGAQLYSYQTGNYITSSPAIINGHVIIASSDSFVYDFTVDAANVAPPKTAIVSPVTGSKVQNPGGSLIISGTASDPKGVTEVQLAIQMAGPTGPWFATSAYNSGAYNNFVGVDHPGKPQSTWSFALPIPPAGSTYQVSANAVDLLGQVDRVGAQVSFAVLPNANLPQLKLSTALAPPSSTFTVAGTQFGPNETVDFVLQTVKVGTAKTTQSGSIAKATIAVPASISFGPSALIATGETSGKTTSASIDVSNIWNQSGYGATHTGYEPNDRVLEQSIQATHNGYLSRAWLYMTGAPVSASPTIVAGAAYVANMVGTIDAIDTVSGAPFWTYRIPSDAPIHAAPAVGNGDVIFGADDDNIYRLASATGALIGSATLDGIPTSPALAKGTIYVGTANGTVYAIDEATGTRLWSTPVGAPVHESPAVDTALGVIIVGDDAGHVTTLDPASGVQIRQTSTGGASVTVAPAVASGKILIGASDGILRAFDEKTSALDWTYTAGSPIHALATTGVDVYLGTDAGNIAKLAQTSGKPIFVTQRGVGVVGLAHAPDVSVDETAQGLVTFGKDSARDRSQYTYQTGAALTTQPAIVNGSVFIGAGDGGLYAFTDHGQSPEDAVEHALFLRLRKTAPIPRSWKH